MPKISLPVPETYQSITRPVYQAVIKQLLVNTDVMAATVIGSLGDQESLPLNGSGHMTDSEVTAFNHRQKVLVRYTEQAQEQTLLAQPAVGLNGRFVFSDPELGIGVRPVYTMHDCVLSFIFRSVDKQQAIAWRDDIVRQIRNNRAEQLYEATYKYPFTDVGLVILMDLHRLREEVAPYGETFAKYWKDHTPETKMTFISNPAGDQLLPVVEEQQVNIIGYLDFTTPPTETKGEAGATWEISFDFKFEYERPVSYVMDFPISIHQQIVPGKWYNREKNYTPEWYADQGYVDTVLNAPRQLNWIRNKNYLGIPYPHFDDWLPHTPHPDYLNLFTALLKIDSTDLRKVADLNQLGPYVLKDIFKTYLREQKAFAFAVARMAIRIEIYEGNNVMSHEVLTLGEDLVIRCTRDLDLRKPYHLRINVLHYLDRLTSEDTTTLRKHPEVCITVLRWLYPRMDVEKLTPTVVANKIVKREDYEKVIPKIKVIAQQRVQSFELRWWMFNEVFIVTKRSTK